MIILFAIFIATIGLIGYLLSVKLSEQNTKIATMFDLVNNVIQDVQVIKIQHTVDKISNDNIHSFHTYGATNQGLPVFKQIVVSDEESVSDGDDDDEQNDEPKKINILHTSGQYSYDQAESTSDIDIDEDTDQEPDDDVSDTDQEHNDTGSDIDSVEEPEPTTPYSLDTPIDTNEIRTILYPIEDTHKDTEEVIKCLVTSDPIIEPPNTITVTLTTTDKPDYSKMDLTQLRKLVVDKNPTIVASKLKKKELINILTDITL